MLYLKLGPVRIDIRPARRSKNPLLACPEDALEKIIQTAEQQMRGGDVGPALARISLLAQDALYAIRYSG